MIAQSSYPLFPVSVCEVKMNARRKEIASKIELDGIGTEAMGERSSLLGCMSPLVADSVAKVFLLHRIQIFRTVGAAIE